MLICFGTPVVVVTLLEYQQIPSTKSESHFLHHYQAVHRKRSPRIGLRMLMCMRRQPPAPTFNTVQHRNNKDHRLPIFPRLGDRRTLNTRISYPRKYIHLLYKVLYIGRYKDELPARVPLFFLHWSNSSRILKRSTIGVATKSTISKQQLGYHIN